MAEGPIETAHGHGLVPGVKVLLSPHRKQIDQWLFRDGRSIREVMRLCRSELGIGMGRRTIDAYVASVKERGMVNMPVIPGVVMADRAEEAVHDMQELTKRARMLLHDRISQTDIKTAELVTLMKMEADLYGVKGIADFAAMEERWRKALHAVVRAMKRHTDTTTWSAIQEELLEDEDFTAVLDEVTPSGGNPLGATAKRSESESA